MDFALTRKQLNKKREKEQATPGAPTQAAVPAPGSPPPPGGLTAGTDPSTGLPTGYDPPAPTMPTGGGSEFFTSNAGVLGRQPAPSPGFGTYAPAPPAAPVAPSGTPAPGFDALLPPTFGTPPPVVAAQPGVPVPAGQPPAHPAVELIRGDRPKGADLAKVLIMRYAGFVLFLLIAILMVVFLPSLRHSTSSPSGLGPVTTVAPAAAPTATGGWTAGAGVVSVTTSYA